MSPPLWLCLATVALCLVACSSDTEDSTPQERQYRSHLGQATFFEDQGQYSAAMTEARQAARLQPDRREPHFIIGNLLLESGDAHRALETFRDLLMRQPETATREDRNRSRLGMASALLQLGRPSEARAPLAAMETPEPEPEAQRELLLARAALLDRDIPGALQSIERARHLAPQDSQIGVVHSRILYLSGREEAARVALDAVLQRDPGYGEAWLWQAQWAVARGDLETADAAYLRALEEIGQLDVMTLRKYQAIAEYTGVLRARGKLAQADTYQDLLDNSIPGNLRNRYVEALAAYQSNDLELAERIVGELLLVAPGHLEGGILAGMIAYRQGDHERSDRYLSQYLLPAGTSVDPLHPAAREQAAEPETHLDLVARLMAPARTSAERLGLWQLPLTAAQRLIVQEVTALEFREEPRAARDRVLAALQQSPDDPILQALAIPLLLSAGQPERARSLFSAVSEIDALPPAFQSNLQGLMRQREDPAAAAVAFENSIASDPAFKAAYLNRLDSARALASWDTLANWATRWLEVDSESFTAIGALIEALRHVGDAATLQQALEHLAQTRNSSAAALVLADMALSENSPEQAATWLALCRDRGCATANPQPTDENHRAPSGLSLFEQDLRLTRVQAERWLREDRTEAARKLTNAIAARYPDHLDAALLGVELAIVNHPEPALAQSLTQISERFPTSARPYRLKGELYMQLAEYRKAVEAFRSAWDREPDPGTARLMRDALRQASVD